MYLGIDVDLDAVTAVLVDQDQRLSGRTVMPCALDGPRHAGAELDADEAWRATVRAIDQLRQQQPGLFPEIRALGVSGPAEGVVLVDGEGEAPRLLLPDGVPGAIGRAAELEGRAPDLAAIAGSRAGPGAAAVLVLSVAQDEPDLPARLGLAVSIKDHVRLRLTGAPAAEPSDASATLWLDTGGRAWSSSLLAAGGLSREAVADLVDSASVAGTLRPDVAERLGLVPGLPVAAGASRDAAAALGMGVIEPGQGLLSLRRTGVVVTVDARFAPGAERGVATVCHAVPDRWLRRAETPSAGRCLDWITGVTGGTKPAAALAEAAASDHGAGVPLFLPYLGGERPWHLEAEGPGATGVFFGLGRGTTRADLVRAVLEGVALALAGGQAALLAGGRPVEDMLLLGDAAPSPFWGRILASALGRPLLIPAHGDSAAALGAARLARLAATGESPAAVCRRPAVERVVQPAPALVERFAAKAARFEALTRALAPCFAAGDGRAA